MKRLLRFIGYFVLLIILTGLLFAFAMFEGGFLSWFLFFAVLPIVMYEFGVLFYPISRWHISRYLSSHIIRSGDDIHVTLRIKRTIPFPIYYCLVEEVFPNTWHQINDIYKRSQSLDQPDDSYIIRTFKKVLFPGFKRVIDIPYEIKKIPRGEHALITVRLRTRDIFGLVTKEHLFSVPDQIIAYPYKRSAKRVERGGGFQSGSTASEMLNATPSNAAASIREYVPGDSLTWIDWKQTARRHQLMTKEFEQEKRTDMLVVMDASIEAGKNILAFETAIEVTAGLLEWVREQSSEARFLSIGEKTVSYSLRKSPLNDPSLRRHLTTVEPDGENAIAMVLQEKVMEKKPPARLLLVSTYIDKDTQEILRRMLQQRVHVILFIVQASSWLTDNEQLILDKLRSEGMTVNILTETELAQDMSEVMI